MGIEHWKYVALTITLITFISCKSFDQQRAEKAIESYVQKKFLSPSSFYAKRYYPAQRIKISEEDAKTVNSILSDRNAKAFDSWGIAVDIKALTTYGSKGNQSATFYLNANCDSVISSDVAPYYFKK